MQKPPNALEQALDMTRNVYDEMFEQDENTSYFEGLYDEVRPKSYRDQYRGFRYTILILSYFFAISSIATASYFVYYITEWLTSNQILAIIGACVFLYFIEQLKRRSSNEFFRIYFFKKKKIANGWLVLNLFLLGISVFSSGFGTFKGVEKQAPDAELLKSDSLLNHYNAEITVLETKNADLRANKDHTGTTFYKLSDGISANEVIIADYRKRALGLEKKLDGKNEKLTAEYMAEVEMSAFSLTALSVFFELCFEFCIGFLWYYKKRSFVEWFENGGREVIAKKKLVELQQGSTSHPPSLDEVIAEIGTNTPPISNAPKGDSDTMKKMIELLQQLQKDNESLRQRVEHDHKKTSPTNAMTTKPTIGFHRNRAIGVTTAKPSMTTGTEAVTTTPLVIIDDRYTVPHSYQKGEEVVTVHYNIQRVQDRVRDYTNRLSKAQGRGELPKVTTNIEGWLQYWQAKEQELLAKMNREKMKV